MRGRPCSSGIGLRTSDFRLQTSAVGLQAFRRRPTFEVRFTFLPPPCPRSTCRGCRTLRQSFPDRQCGFWRWRPRGARKRSCSRAGLPCSQIRRDGPCRSRPNHSGLPACGRRRWESRRAARVPGRRSGFRSWCAAQFRGRGWRRFRPAGRARIRLCPCRPQWARLALGSTSVENFAPSATTTMLK